ncbi:MAG TPA: hypothetical protein VGN97_06260 [Mesorhizobium sp.]|jgi:hypothetical protein|nr:hypothetical protein [Mesorhizobium sp.]
MPLDMEDEPALTPANSGNNAAVVLKAFVRKRALGLLTVPASEREAHYAKLRAAGARLAIAYGMPEPVAATWAHEVDLLTRTMMSALAEDEAVPLSNRLHTRCMPVAA